MDWLYRWFPPQASSYADDVDGMFRLIYWITAVAFVLVMALLCFFLVAYRQRAGRRAAYVHGNNLLEIVWTAVPALILVWLTFRSQALWVRLRGDMPPADLVVGVSGKQFNWVFYYPGRDGRLGAASPAGRFDTGDNVEASNNLDVPVGKVVRLAITSQDVIHSLFLPHMRLKQDAVPGRTVEVWFKATRAGSYDIACAELCGFGHATMKGTLRVHDEASYARWLQEHPDAFPSREGGKP